MDAVNGFLWKTVAWTGDTTKAASRCKPNASTRWHSVIQCDVQTSKKKDTRLH